MRYESKKLFSNRLAVLLLIGLLLANGILFYRHCDDTSTYGILQFEYTQAQAQKKYALGDALEQEAAELREMILDAWDDVDFDLEEKTELVTGYYQSERQLDLAVLEKIATVKAYDETRTAQIGEIRAKQAIGFLGAADSYDYRAQDAVAQKYEALDGLQVPAVFQGQMELLTEWELTDLFLFLAILLGGLLLFSEDRRTGILLLLRPTVRGKGSLFLRKLLSLLLFSAVATVLFYGTNVAICAAVFGLENLSAPIQSVGGFLLCPFPYTVFGYLLTALLEKLLWAWAVAALISFFCCCTNGAVGATLLAAVGVGVGILLSSSGNLWVRALSLTEQAHVSERYGQCLMLNLFGVPIHASTAFCIVAVCALLLGSVGGYLCFVKRDTVTSVRRRSLRLPIGNHTNLLRHEAFKLFVSQKGLLWLVVLCLLQFVLYKDTTLPSSLQEYNLKQYAQVLSGEISAEKDAYLASEELRFEELQEKIDFYNSSGADAELIEMLTQEPRAQLEVLPAFETVSEQYYALTEGQSYIHPTGYNYLFGDSGINGDLLSLVLMEVFLILTFAGVYARERETSVCVLQTSVGANRRIRIRKWLLCLLFALVLAFVSFLPQVLVVAEQFGLEQTHAQANSLRIFSSLPSGWRVWQVFALSWVVRAAVAAASTAVTLFFSKKTTSQTLTILFSLAVLVLPPVAALALR